jgi:hypothetical protein
VCRCAVSLLALALNPREASETDPRVDHGLPNVAG